MKLMPTSVAASTTALVFSRSSRIPKLLHPRPSAENRKTGTAEYALDHGLSKRFADHDKLMRGLNQAEPATPVSRQGGDSRSISAITALSTYGYQPGAVSSASLR